MKFDVDFLRLAVISTCLIGSVPVTATPPDDQLSRPEAKAVALDLIDSISDSYDCVVLLDSLLDGLDLDAVQYAAMVRLSGKECSDALQELSNRGAAFRLSFGEIRSLEVSIDDHPQQNMDLIHEVNPEIEN